MSSSRVVEVTDERDPASFADLGRVEALVVTPSGDRVNGWTPDCCNRGRASRAAARTNPSFSRVKKQVGLICTENST